MRMEDTVVLQTSDLTVGYDGAGVLCGVNFSVHKGEIVTLIGPNGAGKSTILKTIARQLAIVSGNVQLLDQDLFRMPANVLAKQMALVMTERIAPELMTCYDVVAMGRYPYTGYMGRLAPEDRKSIDSAISLVDMQQFADRPFVAVSDGQRQRVMLAKAICQEPTLLLLDEPTSFLDIKYKLELMKILTGLAKSQQIGILMSLHELNLAKRISDTVVCVRNDGVSAIGSPETVMQPEAMEALFDLQPGDSAVFL